MQSLMGADVLDEVGQGVLKIISSNLTTELLSDCRPSRANPTAAFTFSTCNTAKTLVIPPLQIVCC